MNENNSYSHSLGDEKLNKLDQISVYQRQLFAKLMNQIENNMFINPLGELELPMKQVDIYPNVTSTAQSSTAYLPALTAESLQDAWEQIHLIYDIAQHPLLTDLHYIVTCGNYTGNVQRIFQPSENVIVIRTPEVEFEVIDSTDEIRIYALNPPHPPKTKNWSHWGFYYGVFVDESTNPWFPGKYPSFIP